MPLGTPETEVPRFKAFVERQTGEKSRFADIFEGEMHAFSMSRLLAGVWPDGSPVVFHHIGHLERMVAEWKAILAIRAEQLHKEGKHELAKELEEMPVVERKINQGKG